MPQLPNRKQRKAKVTVEATSHLQASTLAHIDYKARVVIIVMSCWNLVLLAAVWFFGG